MAEELNFRVSESFFQSSVPMQCDQLKKKSTNAHLQRYPLLVECCIVKECFACGLQSRSLNTITVNVTL